MAEMRRRGCEFDYAWRVLVDDLSDVDLRGVLAETRWAWELGWHRQRFEHQATLPLYGLADQLSDDDRSVSERQSIELVA